MFDIKICTKQAFGYYSVTSTQFQDVPTLEMICEVFNASRISVNRILLIRYDRDITDILVILVLLLVMISQCFIHGMLSEI